jgi:hypothetical protein
MECLNRNSSILEVNAGKWQGEIYIQDGSIIHAHADDRNGEAALNKILCLKGGEFNLRPYTPPSRQTIDGSWEFLLMEAARARDEAGEEALEEATTVEQLPPPMPRPAPPQRPPVRAMAASTAPPVVPNAPAITLPAPVGNRPVRVDEMVVCSAKGEVLYEWQCGNTSDRVSFLEFLTRKSVQLGEGLNLGSFDRLEVETDRSRVIAQIKKDRGVFVRVTRQAPHSTQ